ncbi:unnamed protein product [Rotaria sordida]|uniref:RING-type domain-containing protein n=1 Tax=Rotaria sordida TaxID=392033 RepID=A0A815Y4A0_9BILA|nr:unnamed protein product [Rotaria sordida]CAF1565899.1 unnamed protein product [Rotaria sordida]
MESLTSYTIPIDTYLVHQTEPDHVYFLHVDETNDKTFVIKGIRCLSYRYTSSHCTKNFQSKYLNIQYLMFSTLYILKMTDDYSSFQQLLRNLSFRMLNNKNEYNLTYIISNYNIYDKIDKPKDPHERSLSTTTLIGIIFLGVCFVFIFGFIIVWYAIFQCRRFTQNRIEKNHRIALAKSAQQMLDKSPIILFDSNSEDNDFTDKDPMCAICLETFKNKEKIRKLDVCSHYFHVTCIDPWLLSHQSCPLCNRNILDDSIPSISSNIMNAENQQNNNATTAIINNDNNQTI